MRKQPLCPKTNRHPQKLAAARKASRFFLPRHPLINRQDRNESERPEKKVSQGLTTFSELMPCRAWQVLFHRARLRTRLSRRGMLLRVFLPQEPRPRA